MTGNFYKLQIRRRPIRESLAVALLLAAGFYQTAAAADDVLLQTMNGKIVTGIVDDSSFAGTLGVRVHRQQFLSNFRSANPGFVSLATGSPSMPPGAQGLPSNHDVSFDLLPISIDTVASNLFYWNGSDADGDGLEISDVDFVVPTGVSWEVFDANFNVFAASGTDQLVPGGLIQRTSADINPSDGVDTGMIHKHLVLQLNDNDGNSSTSPAQGVYMIAWQARSAGFETSDPFLFVMRTSTLSNTVRDLAAQWAQENIEMLISPPQLAGDYNGDGSVDAADYVVWRKTDGRQAAYDAWRTNFGRTFFTGSGAVVNGYSTMPVEPVSLAVPEPNALVLLLLAAAGWCLRRLRVA